MAKKGENIYLRKDGRWEGRYIKGRRSDGRPIFASIYGKQYRDVKRQLMIIKAKLYQTPAAAEIVGDGSLHDWTEYWLELLVRPHVKESTYAGYRRNVEKHIYPALGHMLLNELSSECIQQAANEMKKKLAPSTLQGICRLLKTALKAAEEKGLMEKSPYQGIRVPKARKRPPRVLTRTEQMRLEIKVSETRELEYLLCLYTGLRIGELCALRWENIDFENQSIRVRHSIQRVPDKTGKRKTCLIYGTPKSEDSIRDIPIPFFIASLLQEKKQSSSAADSDFLFKNTKGNYKDPRSVQIRFSQICRELELQGVHMHTLRHTYATRCLELGIRYDILCELLGHSSPQITLKYYAHCTLEDKRRNIELLDRLS